MTWERSRASWRRTFSETDDVDGTAVPRWLCSAPDRTDFVIYVGTAIVWLVLRN